MRLLRFSTGFVVSALFLLTAVAVLPGALAGNHWTVICNSVNLHPTNSNLGTVAANSPYNQTFMVTPNVALNYWSSTPGPVLFGTVTLSPFQVFWSPNTATASGTTPSALGVYSFTITVGAVLILGTICFTSKTYTITVV